MHARMAGPRGVAAAVLMVSALLGWRSGAAEAGTLSVAPEDHDFGPVEVGTTTTAQEFVITNTGLEPLEIDGFDLAGADCAEFIEAFPATPITLLATQQTSFTVSFAPAARGTRLCSVEIESNDEANPVTLVPLEGAGEAAELGVSPASLLFGELRIDTGPSDPELITISNDGDVGYPLTVTDVTLGGDHPGDFVLGAFSETVLDPGQSITVSVAFSPTAVGDRLATVTVVSDDPVEASRQVALSGTGTEAVIDVTPGSHNFGHVVLGASINRDVTVSNTGGAALAITGLPLSGDGDQYGVVPPAPTSVAADGSETVTVRCTPTSVGVKSATLTVVSDADNVDNDEHPQVDLTCRGVKPFLVVDPTTPIEFGEQRVAVQSAAETFRIANELSSNTSDLTVSVSFAGTNPGDFTASDCVSTPCVLPSGSFVDVEVRFTPGAAGARSAVLEIAHDDPDEEDPFDIAVSGTGIEPTIALDTAATIDFGDIPVGTQSASETVTVRNSGTDTLLIDAVAFQGSNPGEYVISSGDEPPPSIALAPGATASWDLRCAPTSQGDKPAVFRVSSDAANTPQLNVSLACRGTEADMSSDPNPIAFPDTRVGEEADEIVVTITNTGNLALEITGASISSSVFPPISGLSQAPPFTLEPAGTFTIGIGFVPAMATSYSETLTVQSPDLPGGAATFGLSGIGRLADMSVDPVTYDFGDVRIDHPFPDQLFTLTSEGDAQFELASVGVDDAANFLVELVSPGSLPAAIAPGGDATFRVTATPQTLGTKTALITVQTDIPGGQVSQHEVSATGVAPDMALSLGAVDFGGHDVQATAPASRTIRLSNPGTAPLEVTNLDITGADAARFDLDAPPSLPAVIPVGGDLDLDITYQPLMVETNADATLEITSDALTGSLAEVPLSGRGIDRVIAIDPGGVVAFPETYRNPAEPAARSVEISNLGEAPLAISMAVIGGPGADSFGFAAAPPQTVPPLGSETVVIEFAPTAAAVSLAAELVIHNDDSGQPMARVDLTGTGVLPDVTIAPGPIDVGRIGVGVPVTVSQVRAEAIEIINMDASDTFTVADVRVVDARPEEARAYRLIGFAEPVQLASLQTLALDVEIVAEEAGPFEAVVEVYIDADPEVVTFLTIRGEAVPVRLRGSGCSAGGDGGGAALLLLAAGALALCRRRRTAASRACVMALVCAAGAALGPGPAAADRTRNLDLTTFRPAPSIEGGLLSVETADVGVPGAWSLGVFFDYAANPLRAEGPTMSDAPVRSRTAAELALAYAFGGRFEAGVLVPMIQQSGDAPAVSGLQPAEGASLGDVAVHGKAQLLNGGALSLGGSATVTLPTARDGQFAGVSGPTAHLRGIVGVDAGRLRVAANGGFRLRGTSELADIEQGSELTYGFGGSFRVVDELWAIGEVFGAYGVVADIAEGTSPLELAVGGRYRVSGEMDVTVGVGRGVLPGIGAPEVRGIVLLSYSPRMRALEPLPRARARSLAAHEPDEDDGDGDGILAASFLDSCDDPDGCLEPAGDGDEVALDPGTDEPPSPLEDEVTCPDEGDNLVMVTPARIETFDPVRFRGNTSRIDERSHALLRQIGATLCAHRDFVRVRIAVHVHPRNQDDQALSEERGEAVRDWLIEWGVEPERLVVRGFGSTRPLIEPRKRGAADVNNRVEFIILEQRIERRR